MLFRSYVKRQNTYYRRVLLIVRQPSKYSEPQNINSTLAIEKLRIAKYHEYVKHRNYLKVSTGRELSKYFVSYHTESVMTHPVTGEPVTSHHTRSRHSNFTVLRKRLAGTPINCVSSNGTNVCKVS